MHSLLPPNATVLERRTAEANRFDLDAPIEWVSGVRDVEPPADFAAWLAAEWFLADFARYHASTAQLIQAGLPWLRQRGTEAAVLRALAWIGLHAHLEEDGALIHLDPGNTQAAALFDDILHLVRRSLPAHVRFYRIHHGYDLRHFRLDASRLDDGLLDDDSGIYRDEVKLSFGTRHAGALAPLALPPLRHIAWHIYSVRVWGDESWRLDTWALDSEILLDAAGRVIEQAVIILPADSLAAVRVMRWRIALGHAGSASHAPLQAGHARHAAHALPVPDRHRWRGPWAGRWRTPVIPHTLTFLES